MEIVLWLMVWMGIILQVGPSLLMICFGLANLEGVKVFDFKPLIQIQFVGWMLMVPYAVFVGMKWVGS